jgi:hypothetical protein
MAEKAKAKKTASKGEATKKTKTVKTVAPKETKAAKTAEAPKKVENTEKTEGKKKWSTKKKVIFWSCLGGGILIIAIVVIIILVNVLSVHYDETYKVADDLKDEISGLYSGEGCAYAMSYAKSSYTSTKDYNKYIKKCKEATTKADELVEKLTNDNAVNRNADIKKEFDEFKEAYDKITMKDGKVEKALDFYSTWHEWLTAESDLSSWNESESNMTKAANILIKSNNDKFKEYGTTWLEKRKAVANAYQAYYDATSNYSDLYDAYSKARNDFNSWKKNNEPDIEEVAGISDDSYDDVHDTYSDVYDEIEDAYKKERGNSSEVPSFMNGASNSGSDGSEMLKQLMK